jgi:hypothetical protein
VPERQLARLLERYYCYQVRKEKLQATTATTTDNA